MFRKQMGRVSYMAMMKKEGLERIGLRIPSEVKEWYMKESLSLGLSMSQYMSFVLVNHQRNQEATQALKNLSEMSKNQDVIETNKEMLELLRTPEFKEAMKEYQIEIAGNRKDKRQLKP